MLKIFFFLLFSCGINAQQLESLKILKTKHDSIETQLKLKYQEEIKGKSDSEISEIYYQNLLSRRKNNRERFNHYFSAVQTFLETQKLIGSSPEAAQQEIPDKAANYSQGFPALYKEVHDFIKNQYQDRLDEYFTKSAKIHFIVQNDHSLYIEKVEGTEKEFNDLALLAFLMTSGKWESAFQRGMNVKSKYVLPVKFVVEE
ncbi:MAG: hypothetical protein KUL74_09980 [Cloacibacterium sp.]|nr:hypothetical protein [Cloacibacterium sp.]